MSNRPELFEQLKESMYPEPVIYFDGNGYPSYAALLNACVAQCPTEKIIILSDKARPTAQDILKLLVFLESGFGFVGIAQFRMIGFEKELMRRIGMMDERYIGGGYDDMDFLLRLKEADIACYLSQEVTVVEMPSSWTYQAGEPHFRKKWPLKQLEIINPNDFLKGYYLTRELSEETYEYDLGSPTKKKWLPFIRGCHPFQRDIEYLRIHGFYLHQAYPELFYYYTDIFKHQRDPSYVPFKGSTLWS